MKNKYTFHHLGLVHLPLSKEFMSCAFTQKLVKLNKMLLNAGHTVYFYGARTPNWDAEKYYNNPNFHFVETHTLEDIRNDYGEGNNLPECNGLGYPWRSQDFRHDMSGPKKPSTLKFYMRATEHINKIKKPDDFLLCTQGQYHKPIADAVKLYLNVESGIGYRGTVKPENVPYGMWSRVFESPYIQNFTYGSDAPYASVNGSFYDRCIPNYFDPDDVEFSDEKDDYYLFVGRMIKRKGILIAYQATKATGDKLIFAGQGAFIDKDGSLRDNDPQEYTIPHDSNWEYLGYADVKTRKNLMAHAKAVFAPTEYIECLLPGERILGSNKKIEDLEIGDSVIQSDGSQGKVLKTIKNNYSGKLITIKPRYCLPVTTTKEHPIRIAVFEKRKLKKTDWVKAEDVTKDKYLIVPKYKIVNDIKSISLSSYIKSRSRSINNKRLSSIKIDKDLMWLFGVYLAEGNITSSRNHGKYIEKRGLCFTFNKNETEYIEKVEKIIYEKFKYKANHNFTKTNSSQVVVSAYPLAEYFAENFGMGAENKVIPQWIMDLPKKHLKHFLLGYIDGDGSYFLGTGRQDKNLSMCTVSKILALQLQLIFTKFDILISNICDKRAGKFLFQDKIVNQKDRYILRTRKKNILNPDGINTKRKSIIYREDENNFYVPIKEISISQYEGNVFNIHTTDNTYLVNNCVVHNCFGGVHVEAMLAGTPVITTDFGVYPYTINDTLNGKVGFRCNTLQDFVDAVQAVKKFTKKDYHFIRKNAERYLMENVNKDYQKLWNDLHNVWESSVDDTKKGWSRVV